MPSHEKLVTLKNTDTETALALVYEAMQHLQWNILYAGDDVIISNTRKGLQVTGRVNGSSLIIRSEMRNGELADITGINKKNVFKLETAFEEVESTTGENKIEQNKESINTLRAATVKAFEQHQREAAETAKAMNVNGSNLYATYTIIAVNVLVFILMAINGAGVVEPDSLVHIKWGSNYSPLTLSGDWWRLFTNMFIHFGILHVGMNMYCLFVIGSYLEPMLGKTRYITAYLCTGVIASIVSLWWHDEGVNSAGASGAIFGVYGLFLALLTTSLIPKAARESLLKSIGIFIAFNLIYGVKSGVDNSAHIGGLISGFLFGYLYVFSIKKEREQQEKIRWIIPLIVLLTLVPAYAYLQQHKVSGKERAGALKELNEASYPDKAKFDKQLAAFDVVHNTILAIVNDTSLANEALIQKIDNTGLPQWQQAAQAISATGEYNISPASHAKATKLLAYIALRKKEMELLKQRAETNDTALTQQINSLRNQAYIIFEEAVRE